MLTACTSGCLWAAEPVATIRTPQLSGIGRPATPAEVKAWDIDVRPDFKGLPPGSGTVAHGQDVWEGKCASCHGTFGESNEVFTPIIGGTTKDDIETGHVLALTNNSAPQRTTMMKLSSVSTLWDYIRRAMPWNAPKSLSNDDVYAVVAYLLNMADVLPDNATLSDKNIAEAQARLPNRNGMTRDHGLWDVNGKADVKSVACMKNCPTGDKVTSSLPDAAKGANGNPADQTRPFGETRAVNLAAADTPPGADRAASTQAAGAVKPDASSLATANGCMACHGVANKIVGPSFKSVAEKYRGRSDRENYLSGKIKAGGAGAWGAVRMPPQAQLSDADVKALAEWVLAQ
ncbi:MAG: c-type cytochrome [Burkholderiaceae bacterium]